MKLIWALFFVLISGNVFSQEFTDFKVDPQSVFTFEDKPVTFTIKISSPESLTGKNVYLLEVENQTLKTYWLMKDDGRIGDKVAGDNIYTRETSFNASVGGPKKFIVVAQAPPPVDQKSVFDLTQFQNPPEITFTVVRRPSFIEAVGQAIGKLFGK